jgi:hypothetical protein
MWNLPAGPTEPSIASVERLLEPYWPKDWDLPLDLGLAKGGHGTGDWRAAFAQCAFEELREARLPNAQIVDPAGLVAFFASMGWIDGLPDEDRLPLLEQIRSLLNAVAYRVPWETHVHWTRLAANPSRG